MFCVTLTEIVIYDYTNTLLSIDTLLFHLCPQMLTYSNWLEIFLKGFCKPIIEKPLVFYFLLA
jgi:hypothetical protein